jgi:UV DNA damage endonuclease
MRIGYPCINRSIGCSPARTFRLASWSDERLSETVTANLSCLENILSYNIAHGVFFFRITSDLVPFASHPVNTFPWQEHFSEEFRRMGEFIRSHRIRISMHPDQFVLLNSPDPGILERSIADLRYQVQILDLMELDSSAKVQLHVGGIYRNKPAATERFVNAYDLLEKSVMKRLVIENDERLYSVSDCLAIHERTGIPVLLDVFHHSINNNHEHAGKLLERVYATWNTRDGIPMADYSSQHPGRRAGAHADHLDPEDFRSFLDASMPFDFDIMLEIKDKEKSALEALSIARDDTRLYRAPTKTE